MEIKDILKTIAETERYIKKLNICTINEINGLLHIIIMIKLSFHYQKRTRWQSSRRLDCEMRCEAGNRMLIVEEKKKNVIYCILLFANVFKKNIIHLSFNYFSD